MKPKFRSLVAAFAPLSRSSLIVCASLCAVTSGHADQTWTGATDAAWGTLTNWSGGAIPLTTENAVFDSSSTANLSAIALGANRTIKGITFTSPATDVTIVAGSTLNINGGGIDMSGATANLTSNAGLNLSASGQQNWSVNSGRTLTLASLGRTTSGGVGNLNVGASLTLPATGGTVKVGAVAIPVFADGQGNPYVTYGLDNWAGTDATGNVVGSTNLAWNASIGTAFQGPSVVTGSFTQTGNGGTSSILFSDTVTAHTLTLAASTVFTGRGVMVASNSVGGTITGGSLRPNRSASGSGGNSPMNFVQNSLLGDLRISNLSNASSSTTVSLVKSGVGKMILTGATFHTGGTFINEGILQVGEGAAAGTLQSTSNVVIQPTGSLVMNVSADLTMNAVFGGSGAFTQQGSGTTTLGGASAGYTGTININGGAIAATSLANIGSGTAMGINGGSLKFLGAFDPTSRTVTIGSSGATFDTSGNAVSFAGAFASGSTGAVTKSGAGSLTLGADNDYSGGTTITGGTLLANAPTSSTGSGAVAVNSGGSVGGTGKIAGAVSVASGANLAPGASVGTLTVGSLNLASGSTATFEFKTSPDDNDKVAVTTPGGLTINGGAITLLQENSIAPFTGPGGVTYNLISYSGSIGGAGPSSLSVANPQSGFSYTFGASGGFVTLTINTTGIVRQWNSTAGGTWTDDAKWTPTGAPNAAEATANFTTVLDAPSLVTLDGSKSVGSVVFTSGTNGYTIAQGTSGSLILNNGVNPAGITTNDGNHEISAPITLTSNTSVSTAFADDSITLSGVVTGSATLTKTGPGGLSLLGNNTLLSGAVTLAGRTTFANNSLGTGNLTVAGSLVWASGNSQDISNRTITFGASPVTFDTNENDVALLTNGIGNGGAAAFTKAGLGKLTLGADANFSGIVTISGGVLQLGNGGSTGLVSGAITNNAGLEVKLAGGSILPNLISGTGSVVHSGTGSLNLSALNTYSGTTSITSATGSLILTDPLNIQSSTLNYDSAGGTLNFDTVTAATLGGLAGDKSLVLENSTPAAVALTIGTNGQATSYTGNLSGAGSLTKIGTGTSTINGVNSYTGATNANQGVLEVGGGGSITGTTATIATNGTLRLNDGTLVLSGLCNLTNTGGSAVLDIPNGTATLSGGLQALGNANNGYLVHATFGTLSTPFMRLGRGSLNFGTEGAAIGSTTQGLYVDGGAVNISGVLEMGVGTLTNSSVSTYVLSGSLSVGGRVTVGLNNGGRWSVLQVSGGTFDSSDTVDGVVLGGPFQGNALFAITGGVSTVNRIQLGQGTLAGTSVVRVGSGELYVGSGGIVRGSVNNAPEIRLVGGLGCVLGAKAP